MVISSLNSKSFTQVSPSEPAAQPAREDAASQTEEKEQSSLSFLAQLSLSHEITDLSISSEETSFAYYKNDHSLALQAHSKTDIHLKQEHMSFDLTFSAEALGLTAKDFVDSGKPIKISFSYNKTDLQFKQVSNTRLVKTLRKPEDILTDLSKALRRVMQDRGNKSVSYALDDEAIQALAGDASTVRLLAELVMLMASINLQQGEGERTNYKIFVSGKGKPYVDHQVETQVEGKLTTVDFNITINPPSGTGKAQSSAAPASTSSQVEAVPQAELVDVRA